MVGRILLLTGGEAASAVRKYAQGFPALVHVCGIGVASLLSVGKIMAELSGLNLRGVSCILVPGEVRGDVSIVSRRFRIPCFKGTKHAADLPLILPGILQGGIQLSAVKPADDVLDSELKRKTARQLKEAYGSKNKKTTLVIGSGKKRIRLGREYPSYVVAEINDAPLLSGDELKEKALYYRESGADVIDVGMVSGGDYSRKIGDIVGVLKSAVPGVPLSIDSFNIKEILAGVDVGVDLVLSLDESNYNICSSIDVPAVVVPRDVKGRILKNCDDRLRLIYSLTERILDEGFNKSMLICDPVMSPLNYGFTGALESYMRFRRENPDAPMLFGAGNVTEMLDADSVGVNALLAGIASELRLDLVFTTEGSVKTCGSVGELSTAVGMMYLSRIGGKPPKDLGLNMLRLKDKKRIPHVGDSNAGKIRMIDVGHKGKTRIPDKENTFRIHVNDEGIVVAYYSKDRLRLRFRGGSAEDLYKEILGRMPNISCEHAAYLGKELMKAELALNLNKNYVQDEGLFKV